MNFTDINGMFCPTAAAYPFIHIAQEAFSQVEHYLDHKESLKYKSMAKYFFIRL